MSSDNTNRYGMRNMDSQRIGRMVHSSPHGDMVEFTRTNMDASYGRPLPRTIDQYSDTFMERRPRVRRNLTNSLDDYQIGTDDRAVSLMEVEMETFLVNPIGAAHNPQISLQEREDRGTCLYKHAGDDGAIGRARAAVAEEGLFRSPPQCKPEVMNDVTRVGRHQIVINNNDGRTDEVATLYVTIASKDHVGTNTDGIVYSQYYSFESMNGRRCR